jgi:hypothetical protein
MSHFYPFFPDQDALLLQLSLFVSDCVTLQDLVFAAREMDGVRRDVVILFTYME